MYSTIAISIIAVIAIVAFWPRSTGADPKAEAPNPADLTKKLRERLLRGTTSEFSIEPVSSVWGVLMELGYPDAAATLVALNDGTASLYFSSGGGVIGGGPHPMINAKARALVGMAATQLAKFTSTSEFPLPKPEQVKFYVLTTNGVLAAGAPNQALGAGGHPLSELFFAGHEVITGLREVTEERKR